MRGLNWLEGIDIDKLESFVDYPKYFDDLKSTLIGDHTLDKFNYHYPQTNTRIKDALNIPFKELPLHIKPVGDLRAEVYQGTIKYRLAIGK